MNVRLRPVALEDAGVLAAMYATDRAEVERTEPWRDAAFFTEEGQRRRLQRVLDIPEQGRLLLTEVDGVVAGDLALEQLQLEPYFLQGSIGYWVAPSHRRRGVATEATRQAVAMAFGELGLHRLQAYVNLDNAASMRVLERNGFRRVGVLMGMVRLQDGWRDQVLFELVAS